MSEMVTFCCWILNYGVMRRWIRPSSTASFVNVDLATTHTSCHSLMAISRKQMRSTKYHDALDQHLLDPMRCEGFPCLAFRYKLYVAII
jgi:hypothetical protein